MALHPQMHKAHKHRGDTEPSPLDPHICSQAEAWVPGMAPILPLL